MNEPTDFSQSPEWRAADTAFRVEIDRLIQANAMVHFDRDDDVRVAFESVYE
jgi:hypothetical protein